MSLKKNKVATPPINAASQEIEFYLTKLQIISVSTFREEETAKCQNLYPANSEKETILILHEYNKTPIVEGQKIKGRIHRRGDERFSGIFLSNISVLSITGDSIEKYCTSKALGGPFAYINDCGNFIVLVRPCCDLPDVIIDRNGNKIATCGGLPGYSKECAKRFLPQTRCPSIPCKRKE